MLPANIYVGIRSIALLAIAVVAGVLLLPGFAQAGAFEDKTKAFTGLDNIGDTKAAFGDFNNDGHVDLITYGLLFVNLEGKKYKKIGSGGGLVMWGDLNNDGHLDQVRANGSGVVMLGDGEGGYTRGVGPPGPFGGECNAASLGDIDNDGLLDIYYCAGVGNKDTLWRQNPKHENKWELVLEAGGAYARSVVGCDFDEDNDIDFYVSNYWLAANSLWVSDGKGGATNQAGPFGATGGSGHSVGACWGDIDNDGYFDIYAGNFAHRGQPHSRFLRNLGPEKGFKFEDLGECGVGYQESFASPTLADYDNDGDLDVYFTTIYRTASYGRRNYPVLYRNDGDWKFTNVSPPAGIDGLGPTYQAAWADFDNDGDLDLMTATRIFVNEGNDNHWLKFRLAGDGKTVNRAAIGAQVRVRLGDKVLTRQVEAGTSGHGNQNDPTLHFGLGAHGEEVSYTVTWPDGTRQKGITGVDRHVTVQLKR